jgi:hypothetical protein
MSKYKSDKKKKRWGGLYPYASLVVQFKVLHQETLRYCSILRPSHHQPFSLSKPHSRALPWHTHAQETLFSSYVDEEFFSKLSIFGAGKTIFTGLSAGVDTLLDSFPLGSGHYKTSQWSPASSDSCCLFAILVGFPLAWVFVLRPLLSASSPLQVGPL